MGTGHELERGRALRAEASPGDGGVGVALDVGDLAVLDPDGLPAAHAAVGADRLHLARAARRRDTRGELDAPLRERTFTVRVRIAILELLTMDSAFRPAIVTGLDMPAIERLARERGFRTMFDNGLNKAQRGLTTLEEVLRATQQ